MKGFEIIDHTADVGILAFGNSIEDIFTNAAYGMFSLMANLDKVSETAKYEVVTEAPNPEELLVAWLNELLYLSDTERMVFSRFEICDLRPDRLTAIAHGERIDPGKHELSTQIKAASYHMLTLEMGNEFRARVILDT